MIKINPIDYSLATFRCLCQRKHLIKDVTYFLSIIQNTLILSTEPESQQPKYQVPLTLENRISFTLNRERMFVQFGIDYKNRVKFFFAADSDLRTIRSLLRNQIMFRDVSDFYQPIKMLGKGGTSKVYLVIERDEKAEFASKCVEKRYLREDGGFESLFNEISVMNMLQHPAIVKLIECFEGENTFYLVLECLCGPSLHELIGRGSFQSLGFDQIKQIMWQILTGVACMHAQNIMHRDLKPENIMFKEANSLQQLRIVDFGLATSTLVAQYAFPKCGTPGYVAPEIANLKDLSFKYDKICDIFSVGCIFYKLITGKDLFPGTDYYEILKLNKKCFVSLDTLGIYRTPQTGVELISRMLCQNPNERITAAQALEHPFFAGTPFSERKLKFQQQKRKEPQNKLWQTQTFKVEKQEKKEKLPEIRLKTKRDDEIPEEMPQINVPALQSPRLAQHAQRKNLALTDNSPAMKKSHFKKFSTQEFDQLSPDTPSPNSSSRGPTLVLNSPRFIAQQQQQQAKLQSITSNFQRYKPFQLSIQEVEDEHKAN